MNTRSSLSRGAPGARRWLAATWLLLLVPIAALAGDLRVRFVDIGQGDSILLHTPGGKAWLVDGGPRKTAATEAIMAAMEAEGLERLDGIVITHPHIDHFGGLIKLVDLVPVGKVLYNLDIDAPSYRRLTDRLTEKGIPYRRVTPAQLRWDPALEVELLAARKELDFAMAFQLALAESPLPRDVLLEMMVWSCSEHTEEEYAAAEGVAGGHPEGLAAHTMGIDLNDYSIVMRVRYGEFELLLTGDATEKVEEELVAGGAHVDADVLKVAHHGSQFSNTLEFLQETTPEAGVIQCETGNSYGHPHRPALQRLKGQGAEVWRTDKHGGILLQARSSGQYTLSQD